MVVFLNKHFFVRFETRLANKYLEQTEKQQKQTR